MKKLIGIFSILFLLITVSYLLFPVSRASALECGDELPKEEAQLNDYIASCNTKLKDLSGQKATLAEAISYLNTQISLTQARIASTTVELEKLNVEIDDLSGKIESIDYSLDDLTRLFVERVKQTYIKREYWFSSVVAQASGLPDLLQNLQYAKKVRDHDRELLVALEKSRLDYDAQKTAKEEKQAEVEILKKTLDTQKSSLSTQKASKDKLLADTKNDEKRYAQLLSAAQSQLAAFSRFVSNQGGAGIVSGQTKCDDWGCYYNQRESEWGNMGIGLSSSSMREYGCLVTSMAMIATHYGKSLNPGQIASSSDPFWGTTAYMLQSAWSVNGVTMNRVRLGSSLANIDSELEAGRPVVVGIYGGPDHFLVIKKKEGDDYIMNDPFLEGGANIKFTDKYPLSAITAVDRVTVN